MDTKDFKVFAGSPNIVINRKELIERALEVGVTEAQLEELTDAELDRLVMFKELKDY